MEGLRRFNFYLRILTHSLALRVCLPCGKIFCVSRDCIFA